MAELDFVEAESIATAFVCNLVRILFLQHQHYSCSVPSTRYMALEDKYGDPDHEMNSKFVYSDLPDASTHIRLLKITSAEKKGSINCILLVWPIKSAPPYNAISYTWGDPGCNTTVIINGEQMVVRTNCDQALRQAFSYDEAQYVWIDAICINQNDVSEKNVQVAMMGGIFGSAQQVLACVGEHADDSDYMFQTFKESQELYEYVWKGLQLSRDLTLRRDRNYAMTKGHLDKVGWQVCRWILRYSFVTLLRAYQTFFRRSYFRRLWIVQELFMAKETRICCGRDTAPIEPLLGYTWLIEHVESCWRYGRVENSLYDRQRDKMIVYMPTKTLLPWLWRNRHREFNTPCGSNLVYNAIFWVKGLRTVPRLERYNLYFTLALDEASLAFAGRRGQRTRSLANCLRTTAYLKCEDPRDTIYGMCGLIDWRDQSPIEIDYDKSAFALAIEVLQSHAPSKDIQQVEAFCLNLVSALRIHQPNDSVRERIAALSSMDREKHRLQRALGQRKLLVETSAFLLTSRSSEADATSLSFHLYKNTGSKTKVGDQVLAHIQLQKSDLLVKMSPIPKCYVVVRQQTAERYGLIGYAVLDSEAFVLNSDVEGCSMDVYADAEDLLIYTLLEWQWASLASGFANGWADCHRAVLKDAPLRFCRYEGSSYAVAQDWHKVYEY